MKVTAIVAVDQNFGIGKNNRLLWHLPDDLKFFKSKTSGHAVVMGRKTFDSLGRPLPKRLNVVITRQKDFPPDGVEVVHSLENALDLVKDRGEENCFIIGGGEIYRQAMPLCDVLLITRVHHSFEAEVFFPEPDAEQWQRIWFEEHPQDEKHAHAFTFEEYRRKI